MFTEHLLLPALPGPGEPPGNLGFDPWGGGAHSLGQRGPWEGKDSGLKGAAGEAGARLWA